ncbi:helix-turn-helix domain-containing protein [Comamonas testosteroni]|uniref:transcriptional regulator n=1 Tax=Comamonas testosteroni TaxID=285 RepID=UPI00265DF9BE|nr:helix-turn-helix domain-containing protein [Comamonas testosteroni]WKL18699.1 helix-turn-helix domain-containing protein [Comamonas testosteroni]
MQRAAVLLGGQLSLAKALKVTPPAVNQWLSGKRPVPAERCPSIERLTGGAVTCEQLRPDVEWSFLRQSSQPLDEGGQ